MTKALFYIQLGTREQIGFGHPFGPLPAWQVYDLDNHADATTLKYADRLLGQAEEVVLVFKQHGPYQSLGGVTGFLESVMRSKKANPTAYSLGPVMLPVLVNKRFGVQEKDIKSIKALLNKPFQPPQDAPPAP
ncbi:MULTISPECIES: hypothetical protein [unclassified Imperialibacter]|uniref:hypothetical protein n=1 Tax=unclassified Imperialibacter TaxID=2629706 RepID=UPI001255AD22|nr:MULTISPECIES: hypothetical protein [unclassified Imperialibacter]CAD5248244.1 hypothetical protein IMPERIA75_10247 [Imperialibacter sp. 75]CAD5248370.1 hypothetical protein IMPERIA89_10248 [Imperialibacter sp. 89]VVS97614.1 hypothetical protein IMPR6_10248 [Imperialibacter sp. EC-SDR9]